MGSAFSSRACCTTTWRASGCTRSSASAGLASALRRDPIGRQDVRGFDRRGAIAALEKAASLAPTEAFYQAQLGVLHSLGDDAVYLEGDLAKAASALEKARELGDTSGDVRLVQVLLALGRTGRLRELADGIEAAEVAGAARLAGAEKDAEFKQALAQIPSASRERAVATFNAAALQVGDHVRVQRSYRLARDVIPSRAADTSIKHLRSVPAQPRTVSSWAWVMPANVLSSQPGVRDRMSVSRPMPANPARASVGSSSAPARSTAR